MNKNLVLVLIYSLFISISGFSQEETKTDSLPEEVKVSKRLVNDSLLTKKKRINPLAPSKAAFYSALLPGLGQVYNKRYWKVPLVYALLGTGVFSYIQNDRLYDRFRVAFKRRQAGFFDDEFYNPNNNPELKIPHFELDVLQNQQERYQRDRDLWLVLSIAFYAVNVIDANVDAHLKQFNVDDDLTLDFNPYFNLDPITNNPNYGMALTIKF